MTQKEDDLPLASACREANTWCCKDGFIFLPRAEYEAICSHLRANEKALSEFVSRTTDHGDFLLYD